MNWTKLVFYILMAMVLIAGVIFYRWIFSYLIASVIFSYILNPAVSFLERKRIPRWMGVLILYLSVAGLIAWFTSRYIPDLIAQGNNLFALLSHEGGVDSQTFLKVPFIQGIYDYAQQLDANVPGLNVSSQMLNSLDNATDFLVRLPKFLLDNYPSIIGAVSFIFTIPLISFFLLKDWYKIRKAFLGFASNRYFELGIILLNKIDFTVGTYLRAMLLEVIAVGIMASVALSIVGVSNPVLIGITAGVANIIPYFGPFFGGALAVFTVFFEGGPFVSMVYAALAMYIVQVIDNNIVYPVVVGTTIDMHPLWVLLTVLAGGWYGGILWMLISVPLVFLIYQLVLVLYTNLKEFRII
jgi:predicted PurR-regulated permease PerM